MNNHLKIIIYSLVAGIFHVGYVLSRPSCEGEGLGCTAVDLGPILAGIIFIPLVFGVIGFAMSKEHRFVISLKWLGISFLVLVLLNIIGGQLR